jgi:AraC-like DNA-binding protein
LCVHDGHVALRLRRRDDIELRSGEAVLIYPHTHFDGHSVAPLSRASVQHFAIESHPVDANRAPRPPFDRLVKLRNGFQTFPAEAGKRVEADIERAMKLAVLEPSPLAHEMRCATLTLILAGLMQQPASAAAGGGGDGYVGGAAFDELFEWAEQNLSRGVTVDALAQRAGLSSSHFRALFARRTGRSAGAFLRDLRLREASRLLRETRTAIKQIAPHIGYGDVATFYHAFRRRFGITPAEYRTRYAPRG